jgi:hypothetical protein
VAFDCSDHRLGKIANRLHEGMKAIDVGSYGVDRAFA